MIDIEIVKDQGKSYSVKIDLFFLKKDHNSQTDSVVTAKILKVEEVQLTSPTSFKKLRLIFDSLTAGEDFNKYSFQSLYNKIVNKLIQKYKMKVLNIR